MRREWQNSSHDREFPPTGGQDEAVHARRAAGVPRLTRRRPGHLPAHPGRQRPGDLPVGAEHQQRAGTAGRRSEDAGRRAGEPAGGRAGPPGTGQGAGWRHRGLRRGRQSGDGRLRLVRTGLRDRPDRPEGGGRPGADAGPGAGSPARPDRPAAGVRVGRRAAGHRAARARGRQQARPRQPARRRRARARAGPREPGRRLAGDVRAGRVHRGGGDGPAPRLLVVPRRFGRARGAGRRIAGHQVAHRRPRQPGTAVRRGGLSRRGHSERRRVPPPGQAGRVQRGGRYRPHRVSVPGDGVLGGCAQSAGGGAEPGPADDAAGHDRREQRPGRRPARGHRPALAGHRPRRPRLDRRWPDRVDDRRA